MTSQQNIFSSGGWGGFPRGGSLHPLYLTEDILLFCFQKTGKNDFNHLIFSFSEIINTFFGKSNGCSHNVSPNICKNAFLSYLNFIPCETSTKCESVLNIPGKEECSIFHDLKDLQLWLMAKSSTRLNCQNSLCSQGRQIRYFLLNQHTNFFIWKYAIEPNNVKHECVNIHYWKLDLSRSVYSSS